jgi:tRNA threonylcarbamoyladenosine biosynthesis protein TsaB
MILCLETATHLCSVALCDKNGVVAIRESDEGRSHASLLTVFAGEVLKEAGIGAAELEAIAVSKGPGSYTGLRIGVSAAKGMAYATSVPLIGISTTTSMFHGFRESEKTRYSFTDSDLFAPALDARRMELYLTVIDSSCNTVKKITAEIVGSDTFRSFPASSRIFLFGDGAAKCRGVVEGDNIIIVDDFRISASYMQVPAFEALRNMHFEDVAYFEPFYLKDFLTSKPKNSFGF